MDILSDDDLRRLLDEDSKREGVRKLAARLGVTPPTISTNRPGERIRKLRKFSEHLANKMGFIRVWVKQ